MYTTFTAIARGPQPILDTNLLYSTMLFIVVVVVVVARPCQQDHEEKEEEAGRGRGEKREPAGEGGGSGGGRRPRHFLGTGSASFNRLPVFFSTFSRDFPPATLSMLTAITPAVRSKMANHFCVDKRVSNINVINNAVVTIFN